MPREKKSVGTAVVGNYDIAADTKNRIGLRRNELDTMTWGDVEIDRGSATYTILARNAKNRKTRPLPLDEEVASELRKIHPANCSGMDFLFPDGVPSMETFKADLKAAGIMRVDEKGRVVDFHALRKTLCTDMGRAGISPWIAMKIMRHSDIRLTEPTGSRRGLVRGGGLEPPRVAPHAPQTCVSAIPPPARVTSNVAAAPEESRR